MSKNNNTVQVYLISFENLDGVKRIWGEHQYEYVIENIYRYLDKYFGIHNKKISAGENNE